MDLQTPASPGASGPFRQCPPLGEGGRVLTGPSLGLRFRKNTAQEVQLLFKQKKCSLFTPEISRCYHPSVFTDTIQLTTFLGQSSLLTESEHWQSLSGITSGIRSEPNLFTLKQRHIFNLITISGGGGLAVHSPFLPSHPERRRRPSERPPQKPLEKNLTLPCRKFQSLSLRS